MKLSCNGCRVLRKGCSEDCSLRPCLEWLNSPESEANATLFLAKFYGRAGLLNLINAAPTHLRSEIFRSLLYEACGRIINPVYGSVGLMSSGDWPRCLTAVEAVLHGGQLTKQVSGDHLSLQGCDIRHVRTRNRRKRSASWADSVASAVELEAKFSITGWDCGEDNKDSIKGQEFWTRALSHDSFSASAETVEHQHQPSCLMQFDERTIPLAEPEPSLTELGLELTLCF